MKFVRGIALNDSKEEILPDFDTSFPYIASCAELDVYFSAFTPWHWHGAAELFYVKSGTLIYHTPHGEWAFPAGSGGMVNANVLHSSAIAQNETGNVQLLHLFDPILLAGAHGSKIETKYILPLTTSEIEVIPLNPEDAEQAEIIREIHAAFALEETQWGYELVLREALTKIWLRLFEVARPMMRPSTDKDTDEKLKTMLDFIHRNYGEEFDIDRLAQSANISRRSCFRLFRECLHLTPLAYLHNYRLEKACRKLAYGSESVTEIAYSCGFGSCSYFSKLFRAQFGSTPLEYRKRWHDRNKNRHETDSKP